MLLDDELRAQLSALEDLAALRALRPFQGADRSHPATATRDLLAFCSNDYLGLANHPFIADEAARACATFGFGAGASRLVSGGSPVHQTLEAELAAYVHQEAALLFPTGYQANLGVLTALAGPNDLIASDAANHASIVDACRLSRARVTIYRHTDAADAARALNTPGTFRRRILVTESLFSMDGNRAPLPALAQLALQQRAVFIVDEAHALGVLGPGGRGLCVSAGLRPDVTIGTLGKAFASLGGFAAASAALCAVLVNTARTFIFTTASPNPVVAAALAALRLIDGPEGDTRRRRLQQNTALLRASAAKAGFPLPAEDAIVPVLLGTNSRALAASAQLLEDGILVPAIRPPTVPEGTARLRLTLSASHTETDVSRLATSLIGILSPRPLAPEGA